MDDTTNKGIQTFHGGCPHDCPDTCSMVYEVEDGKLKGVSGNKDHPMTRGGLCVKLKDYENLLVKKRRSGKNMVCARCH